MPETDEDLLAIAARVAASAAPGEQVEAFVARGRRFSVRAYDGEVESLVSAESAGIGVRVVRDARQGFAHAGSLDPHVVADTLEEARANAAFGEPDEWAGLAVPDGVAPPDLDLFRPEMLAVSAGEKIAMALALERATRGADRRVAGIRHASYGDGIGEAAVVTSTGISAWSRSASCWLSVLALARDGERTQTGSGVAVARVPGDLDVEAVAADGVARAVRMIGAEPIASRRTTVVFDPRSAAAVLGVVAATLSGDRVLKGRSPFRDRLGEQIASPLLTLVDDATNPESFGADQTDGEGLATRCTTLIDAGRLRSFLHSSYTGRRSGHGSTASAVRGYASTPGVGALALTPRAGEGDLEAICAQVGDGIVVYGLSGLHSGVNPVSGDFSVGVDGLLLRDGAPGQPVREVTIASTLQRMLLDVRAVGADLEWLPGGSAGVTLAIDGLSLSGR